jgi:hypothetical protein
MPVNYAITAAADGDKGVTFNYQGLNRNSGPISAVIGHLSLNVQNGTVTNYGLITAQGGIGGAAIDINVATRAGFVNGGRIDIDDSPHVSNSLGINIGASVFTNTSIIEAHGAGQTITVSANGQGWRPQTSSYQGGSIANNGLMQVSSGAYMFLNAPIVGTGTLEAITGSRILLNGPVAAGETVDVEASTLEFGARGTFGNPAMQFLGKITGESASSTILLNGSYGVSEAFKVTSTAGAGLSDLQVFDSSHQVVADLTFVGHFQAADFVLTPHAGNVPANAWTSISFVDHANMASVPHS